MRRSVRQRNDSFRPRAIKRIDVNVKNPKLRGILVAFFAAVAIVSFIYFGITIASEEPGWKEITAESDSADTCALDFSFYYNLGQNEAQGGMSATEEYRTLTQIYGTAAEKGYKLLQADVPFDDYVNIYAISHHPNEALEVDPVLYQMLEVYVESGRRDIYLGPVYQSYFSLFYSGSDYEAENYEPRRNESVASYFREVCAFANDPAHINLELMGNNTLKLAVSQEYLNFIRENEIEKLLDLFWMKNAFLVDYLANVMVRAGFTNGTISSNDGFSRLLDTSGTVYSTDIVDVEGELGYKAASLQLTGAVSIISLHDFDLYGNANRMYYIWSDGSFTHPFVDPKDGVCRSSLRNLTAFSRSRGCAETLLRILPVFIADEFDAAALQNLKAQEIYSVYCEDRQIIYNQPGLSFENVYANETVIYKTKLLTD